MLQDRVSNWCFVGKQWWFIYGSEFCFAKVKKFEEIYYANIEIINQLVKEKYKFWIGVGGWGNSMWAQGGRWEWDRDPRGKLKTF